MAFLSAIHKLAILLALLICLQILLAEGRQLRQDNLQQETKTNLDQNTLKKNSEGSQPTPPSQSPNVHDQFEAGKQVMQPPSMSPSGSLTFEDSLAAYKDDFRPTTPGFSPGVGHPRVVAAAEIARMKTNSNQNTLMKNSEGSQPTPPSQSPNVHDRYEAGKQVMQPPSMSPSGSSSFEDSLAAYKDDFRPTTPGFSPGVGHPKVVATAEIAGSTDDFRPTGPGHSPGVGHAFRKESVEPHA